MKVLKISGDVYQIVKVSDPEIFSDLTPFAPVIATPKRLKGEWLTDDRLWGDVEAQCGGITPAMWREIARADRKIYDSGRVDRPRSASSHKGINSKSGKTIYQRKIGGHFVAVDSEGATLRTRKVTRKTKGIVETTEWFDQRTILWMAGGQKDTIIAL